MASIAESTLNTLEYEKLTKWRDDLLQQPPNEAQASGAADHHHPTSNSNSKQSTVPEPANAYNTPHSPSKAPPRLSSSKSAPAKEMEAMMAAQTSPSQEPFREWMKASSFSEFTGGDTQPMDSQVYRTYTESMANPTTTTPKKVLLRPQISPEGKTVYEMETVDEEPNTYVEGESGYVDLVKGWQESSPGAQSESSHASELLRSPETQLQVGEMVQQNALPETPSLAGSKRKRDSQVLTSVPTTNKKTPGFTQLFGRENGGGGVMTATQLFNQTQAPSSPVPEGPRSDPIMTRPSPNLQNQYSVSSPSIMASSPVATRNSRLPAVPGDPRDHYRSVKESQEARAAALRQDYGVSARFNEQFSDDDGDSHDTERRRFEQKRLQRVMSETAINEWQRVRARPRPGSRPTSSPKRMQTIDLVTPGTSKMAARWNRDVEEDFDVERNAGVEEDAGTEGDAGVDEDEAMIDLVQDDGDNDADVYDELAQTVLRSQGPAEDLDDGEEQEQNEGGSDRGSDNGGEDEPDGDQDDENWAGVHQQQFPRLEDDVVQNSSHQAGTQPSAIADSQPLWQPRASSTPHQRGEEGPSLSSFIPGSQYTGKTSVDQAVMPRRAQREASQNEDKVPSSPPLPLPFAREESGAGSTKTSQGLPRAAPRMRKQASYVADLEVPESDLALPDATQQRPSSRRGHLPDESNNGQLFSTARSHASASGRSAKPTASAPSPAKAFASQQSKSTTSQTPRTKAGVRHFADIAEAASTPNGSGETENEVDIDAIMSDMVTAEDQQVFDVMESPGSERPNKRRKTMKTFAEEAAAESPVKGTRGRARKGVVEAAAESPVKSTRSRAKRQARFDVEDSPVGQAKEQEPDAEPPSSPPPVLQDAPSRANERRRHATPPADAVPESTPDSVKQREDAGAKVASQLLSRRSSRAPKPSALRNLKNGRATGTKRTKGAIQEDDSTEEQSAIIEETVLEEASEDNGQQAAVEDQEQPQQQATAWLSDQPTRVLALFKGNYNSFYPATWLGTSPDGRSYRIKFEDGNITSLDPKLVLRFELRAGDIIKVDLPNMRNKSWVVDRMGRAAQTGLQGAEGVDCHGYATVFVLNKASRVSGNKETMAEGSEESVEVALSFIYLNRTMLPHFFDREFTPPNRLAQDPSRPATPSNGMQTPDSGTPTSRSRRTTILTTKAQASRLSNLRDESVMSASPSEGQRLFTNMAFAISYGSNEVERAEVTRSIVRNGGIILEQGFDELFELPKLDDQVDTSPNKKSARNAVEDDNETTSLTLKPQYERLGFVALIADKHSRRAKYVQALALGLPTLSGRWVADSLDCAKNTALTAAEAAPLSWSKYLLPAGESAYLGNAVRSRTMAAYPASEAKLATTIQNRDILLTGDGVLIVASKKSKAVWERRKAYAFLTLALGAGGVKRVSDLAEAKAFADGEESTWKWVYVDGSVADASKAMFEMGSEGGKKRKRDTEGAAAAAAAAAKVDAKAMFARDGRVTIVNDEFVVQSLILGALVD
ncbi:radiation sensitive protein rad9 [Saxophila tyrrhenica]|uniref:Radiation sensitive protein rad9 n=1 Tax=Saxophila tyrrhenica TaxID=1690608 RepID=A0AAV9NU38_9PEZI|nr:radiation sensitive protein rad9 [Saxophila tyrrhenica]